MRNTRSGFTLIEIIITISITSVVLVVTSGVLLSVVKAQHLAMLETRVSTQGSYLMNLMEEEIRIANKIEVLSPSVLKLTRRDGTEYTFTFVDEVSGTCGGGSPPENGKITLKIGLGSASDLSNTNVVNGVSVTALVFSPQLSDGTVVGATITSTVSEPTCTPFATTASREFKTVVVARSSYR